MTNHEADIYNQIVEIIETYYDYLVRDLIAMGYLLALKNEEIITPDEYIDIFSELHEVIFENDLQKLRENA